MQKPNNTLRTVGELDGAGTTGLAEGAGTKEGDGGTEGDAVGAGPVGEVDGVVTGSDSSRIEEVETCCELFHRKMMDVELPGQF
jgi:hypothetical protein